MKHGKQIVGWTVIAALGYATGYFLLHTYDAQNCATVFKTAAALFAFAFTSIGLVLKITETPPPSDYDDKRKEYWREKFAARWCILWIRWGILAFAGIAAIFAGFALDGKFTVLPTRHAIATGTSAILIGIVGVILTVHEIFRFKRTMTEVQNNLQSDKKRREILDRLEGPPPQTDKHTSA